MPFDDDPFADTSPWDEPSAAEPETPKEQPVTTPTTAATTPAPFKIGFTAKAGGDYGAEWLTPSVYGHTAQETATRGVELLTAMKEAGLIELNAKFAQYTREKYQGGAGSTPKRFENGKVVATGNATNSDYTCEHGQRTFKDGGSWAAYFCGGRGLDKPQQCPPLWRQKDGSFRAK
ncbi:hypothetical protein M1P56_10010 [Streptomyces sp. HU2014]|uniref:hypothetical protein n=1 Tax=Streptomyces sp. HU2014 TaxID=2939414 RepID=UPI0020106C91|nr:hypothetical protein [Streptomyces sp. HU2014]UQI44660.1 hypothetical protein M1P56_10010 [Streptomyces sp. HU2014]